MLPTPSTGVGTTKRSECERVRSLLKKVNLKAPFSEIKKDVRNRLHLIWAEARSKPQVPETTITECQDEALELAEDAANAGSGVEIILTRLFDCKAVLKQMTTVSEVLNGAPLPSQQPSLSSLLSSSAAARNSSPHQTPRSWNCGRICVLKRIPTPICRTRGMVKIPHRVQRGCDKMAHF